MRYYKVAVSYQAPIRKDVLWAKPVEGGFTLNLFDGGWQPLKLEESSEGSASNSSGSTSPEPVQPTPPQEDPEGGNEGGENTGDGGNEGGNEPDPTSEEPLAPEYPTVNSAEDLPVNLTAADDGATYVVGTPFTFNEEELAEGDRLVWDGTQGEWTVVKV